MSQLFVLSGPSGVGKDSVIRRVAAETNAIVGVSHTTRSPRDGEVNGYDYHFIDMREFLRMQGDGEFIEWDVHFDSAYAFAWSQWRNAQHNGRDLIVILDPVGMRQARKAIPSLTAIFLMPPNALALRDRMRRRGDDEETVAHRLTRATFEMDTRGEYDYIAYNMDGQVDRAVEAIVEYMLTLRRHAA